MHSSRNLRVRTCIMSPDCPRPMMQFLTPRERKKNFDFEIININLIQADPFNKLITGGKEKLQPVMLKNNKKCSTASTRSSNSMRFPEIGNSEIVENRTRKELPSLKLEKVKSLPSVQKEFNKVVRKVNVMQEKVCGFPIITKPKKVTFSDKHLDVSFGESSNI